MQPLLFAALFDGSLLTIITHPFAVMALAYGVPLAVIYVVTKVVGIPIPFVGSVFNWLLSADPSQAAQIQAAVKTEVSAATAALTAQLDRIESQLQAKSPAAS